MKQLLIKLIKKIKLYIDEICNFLNSINIQDHGILYINLHIYSTEVPSILIIVLKISFLASSYYSLY